MSKSINQAWNCWGGVGADPEMKLHGRRAWPSPTCDWPPSGCARTVNPPPTGTSVVVLGQAGRGRERSTWSKGQRHLRVAVGLAQNSWDRRRRPAPLPRRNPRPGGGVPGLRPQRRQPLRQRLCQWGQRRRQPPGQRRKRQRIQRWRCLPARRRGLPLLTGHPNTGAFPKAQHGAAP